MPYKDLAVRKVYMLEHSRSPAQRAKQIVYRRNNPDINKSSNPVKRNSHLKRRYGITDNDYYALLAKQGGGCAICNTVVPINGKGNRFFDVDHDHVTGKVRGLLCRDCNVTVGVIEKKAQKILLIKEYLSLHVEFDPKDPEKAVDA